MRNSLTGLGGSVQGMARALLLAISLTGCAPRNTIVTPGERRTGAGLFEGQPSWGGPLDQYRAGISGRLSLPWSWYPRSGEEVWFFGAGERDARFSPNVPYDFVIEQWRHEGSVDYLRTLDGR